LFVEAFPTSFYTSPTEFAATAIVHGGKLFAANCTTCHGADGQGDGPAAQSLPIRPADLTAEHLWAHSDGEMYWYISHGFEAPQGGITMPGFAGSLSSEGRWDLIDYLRAHNAGESMRKSGKWPHPLPVPQFDAECAEARTIDLDDLRGSILRIIAASGEAQVVPVSLPGVAVTTIIVTPTRDAKPTPSACIASEPETWTAFAILLGVSPNALAGAQILVDQNAWLRAAWRPGDPGDWTNPRVLEAEIRDIVAHPIAITASVHVHHH
jgi:mono/diheme cytochrome c family protein